MPEKRSYKELTIRLDEHMESVDVHLQNIDQHLNRLNERTRNNEKSIAKIYGIGSGCVFIIGIVIAVLQLV
jgi:ferritin-like metal-binding protein YciE